MLCIGGLSEIDVVLALANVRMTGGFPESVEFIEEDLHRAAACAKSAQLVSEPTPTGEALLRLLDMPISFSTDPNLGRVVEVGDFDHLHGNGAAALALLHLLQTGSSGTCFLRPIIQKGKFTMTLALTAESACSIELGSLSHRDVVELIYGWHLARAKGPVDIERVRPKTPDSAWTSSMRLLYQMGGIDEVPLELVIRSVERETGLKLSLDDKRVAISGLCSADFVEVVQLLQHRSERASTLGLRSIVGLGAAVNVGTSFPLVGWILDLELLEVIGIESVMGPCLWAWGATVPMLIAQVLLLRRGAKRATA